MIATHIRKADGLKVIVTREYEIFIVRKTDGVFIAAFYPDERSEFYKTYEPVKRG